MSQNSHSPPPGLHSSLRPYLYGFGLSLLLTLAAFFLAQEHLFSGSLFVIAIAALGFVQVIVQMLFFLGLGGGSDQDWSMTLLFFMVLVVLILVAGSIWIMTSLDARTMMPMH